MTQLYRKVIMVMRLKIIDIFRVLLLYDLTLHYVTAYLRWSSRMTSLSHGGTKPKGVFGSSFSPFSSQTYKKNQETGLKGVGCLNRSEFSVEGWFEFQS